jgi:hypothetical protein
MADWFTSFASQALKFADEIADSLVNQANEAQQQLVEEQSKLKQEVELQKHISSVHQLLPWETNVESRQILSKALMENILSLSCHESNFTLPSPNAHEIQFNIHDFAPIAMKVIQLDSNLARLHAKWSPKMNEEDFWFHYYCRIMFLRAESGIDGLDAQKNSEKYKRDDVIYTTSTSTSIPLNVVVQHSPTNSVKSGNNTIGTPISHMKKEEVVPNDHAINTSVISTGNNEINLDNLDDLDLGDLGDLDALELNDEDFENIAVEDCEADAELEAQIAKELEDME